MRFTSNPRLLTAAMFALAIVCTPALAQYAKNVDGLVINLGIMPAEVALRADGHRDAHPPHPPPGSEHLLVTLDDEKTKHRIGDADVVIEVTDPHGRVQKKQLLHTQAGGLPDYSDLFEFAWSGDYKIRVVVTPRPGAKPIEARFTVTHEV